MRRVLVWSVALPLLFAGTVLAHSVAYRLAYPSADVRLRVLVGAGHEYWSYLPWVAGVATALGVVSMIATVFDALRGGRPRPLPAWVFGVLPPVAYACQEFIERWLHGAAFPWWCVLQPTFRYGLLLQVPFGLAAYLVARLLLRVARSAARAIALRPGYVRIVSARVVEFAVDAVVLAARIAAQGRSSRGPPLLAA